MSTWAIVDDEEAPEDTEEVTVLEVPRSRRLLDPIAHAWRIVNPKVPLPRKLLPRDSAIATLEVRLPSDFARSSGSPPGRE